MNTYFFYIKLWYTHTHKLLQIVETQICNLRKKIKKSEKYKQNMKNQINLQMFELGKILLLVHIIIYLHINRSFWISLLIWSEEAPWSGALTNRGSR